MNIRYNTYWVVHHDSITGYWFDGYQAGSKLEAEAIAKHNHNDKPDLEIIGVFSKAEHAQNITAQYATSHIDDY